MTNFCYFNMFFHSSKIYLAKAAFHLQIAEILKRIVSNKVEIVSSKPRE